MAAVNTVSRDLGLRPASIVVLDALLSCLPCKNPETGRDAPITPRTLLTVFASNETLSFRAKGITDRQLRRHLERLEEVGLIQRRDSANKKRFPIYRAGKVVAAFGLDLSPLLGRAQDLLNLAQTRRDEAHELRGLKARVQALRTQCLNLTLSEDLHAFVESTRNLLRRAATTVVQARAVLQSLTDILVSAQTQETSPTAPQEPAQEPLKQVSTPEECPDQDDKTPAGDGRNVRHKEPEKPYTKKILQDAGNNPWNALKMIPSFYPETPTSEHACHKIIYEFGRMLGIGYNTLSKAIDRFGMFPTLEIQDQIAGQLDRISNPDGYLLSVLTKARKRGVGHGQLPAF